MPYDGTEISQTNILINARNRLEKGWCQGHFELVSEDGNSVLVVAICPRQQPRCRATRTLCGSVIIPEAHS